MQKNPFLESYLALCLKQYKQEGSLNQEELIQMMDDSNIKEEESALFFEALISQGVSFEEGLEETDDLLGNLNYESSQEIRLMDPVKQYLMSIGTIDLLKSHEEIALAKRILEGKKALSEITLILQESDSMISSLQAQDISDLQMMVDDGNNAKNDLVSANLRLVVSIAKKYSKFGLPLLDLIQEGNLGLIKAAEKYDSDKGFKFSTYATWWIRQAITRAIADTSRTIRLPVHVSEDLFKIRKVMGALNQHYERSASYEEIAIGLNIDVVNLIDLDLKGFGINSKEVLHLNDLVPLKKRYSAKEVEDILSSEIIPVSMDAPIGDEKDSHLEDFIEDKETIRPDVYTNNRELSLQITRILKTLSEKEERILQLRFGLADGKIRTLEEVGQLMGLTRERIRQIESKAIKKLRHPDRSKGLIEFYEGN